MTTDRPYASVADLRRMQRAASAAVDTSSIHVGDLAWLVKRRTHVDLRADIHLWEDGGELIGWTFLRSNGEFNVFVAPGRAEDRLLDQMLAAIDDAAASSVSAGDPPVDLSTYGIDPSRSYEDGLMARALERHGFSAGSGIGGLLSRSLRALPPAIVPVGYRLSDVRTREQVLSRVEAHRLAFAPSELTFEAYERARRTWPYRGSLDRIATDEDGTVVAFCTAWTDPETGVGLLEPVGTHPEHRRRGLARAVCLDAMLRLRDAGARTVRVGFVTEAARRTYVSLGFEPLWADGVSYRRPAGRG